MRKDRKGVGGFMETMVAMMIVTIVISMFMTTFAYNNMQQEETYNISTDFLNGLSISEGRIIGLDPDYTVKESERMGYHSMTIHIHVAGTIHDIDLETGTFIQNCNQEIRNGTFMLTNEKGDRFAATYEVVAFV